MKYLNLIILLLFLLACQDKKKDRDQAFSIRMARKRDTISERHGLCTGFATDTVDFTLPKSPHKVLVFVVP